RPPLITPHFPYTTLFRSNLTTWKLGGNRETGRAILVWISLVVYKHSSAGKCPLWTASNASATRVNGNVLIRGRIPCSAANHSLRSEEHTSELQSRENLVC